MSSPGSVETFSTHANRQGERFDCIRSVHDGRLHYLRNFQPQLSWGQFVACLNHHAAFRAWQRLHDAGAE